MKRLITAGAIMTLCSLMLCANPFKGTWEVELVFTDVPLIFRFIDGETLSVQRFGDQSEEFGGCILNAIQDMLTNAPVVAGRRIQ